MDRNGCVAPRPRRAFDWSSGFVARRLLPRRPRTASLQHRQRFEIDVARTLRPSVIRRRAGLVARLTDRARSFSHALDWFRPPTGPGHGEEYGRSSSPFLVFAGFDSD